MKKFTALSSIFVILFAVQVSAQESIIGEINYNTLEKYILAAKQNFPRKKILDTRAEGIKNNITINNLSYLDIFTASYFWRPNQNDPVIVSPGSTTANPYSVNGFQFGASINLGAYLAKPWIGKRAKAEYKVAQLEAQEYNTTLGLEVKKRYYAYVQQIAQLKINAQAAIDNRNVADNMKNRFERGEITLDTYNQSRINLTAANSAKIQSEVTYLSAKDALEEIIGMPLSEVK